MSIASYEKLLVADANKQTGRKDLKRKDLMEWSNVEIKAHPGEFVIKLENGMYCAFRGQEKK